MNKKTSARTDPDWLRRVAWVAVLAPVPYTLSRLLWAAGVPIGIDDELLNTFRVPGWGSLYILGLVLLVETTVLLTHRFLVLKARTMPHWVPLVGRRHVRPGLVVAALLAPITVLILFGIWSLGPITDGFTIPDGNAGLPGWSFWGQIATFWAWGGALTVATAAYWHRMRRRQLA